MHPCDIPFSAVMGLEKARLALQISLVDETLGGVLVIGSRGTGKSVLTRATRFIHPDLDQDNALVKVPLGITEDNLIGSLDLQKILRTGEIERKPGLLERADGRILLIDNVNLLCDQIVDQILDCAAGGLLTIEHQGISASATSRFKLFATMDNDEGRLRPQLLDRFDLSVEVNSLAEPEARATLIQRLLAFEYLGEEVMEPFRDADIVLRECLQKARRRLPLVGIKVRTLAAIAFAMSHLEVDGHRPDLVMTKASGALAALRGRTKVIWDDVRDVAHMVLGHRTRKGGLEGPPSEKILLGTLKTGWGIGSRYGVADVLIRLRDARSTLIDAIIAGMDSADSSETTWSSQTTGLNTEEGMFSSEFPEFMQSRVLRKLTDKVAKTAKIGIGSKHAKVRPSIDLERGKRIRVVHTNDPRRMDVLQTVIAAALEGRGLPLIPLEKRWWRAWEKSSRPRAIVMIVIDASKSSMGYLLGLSGLLRTLFEEHFDPLSRIGLISMNRGASVLHFKPTRNRLRVYGRMAELTSSGYTPLADAISTARSTLQSSNTTGDVRGNFILLVSDCAPEPLPDNCRDPYESELYASVRKQARMCSSAGIPILVIDPLNYPSLKSPEEMPGRRLGRYIEKVTRGMLLHIPSKILDKENIIIRTLNSMAGGNEHKGVSRSLSGEIENYSSVARSRRVDGF